MATLAPLEVLATETKTMVATSHYEGSFGTDAVPIPYLLKQNYQSTVYNTIRK